MSNVDDTAAVGLIEELSLVPSRSVDLKRKSALGQFMTPLPIARFMAGMFQRWDLPESRLLDAGAGIGSLTAAFVELWIQRTPPSTTASVTAYEIDPQLRRQLDRALTVCRGEATAHGLSVSTKSVAYDFIEKGTHEFLFFGPQQNYTHAILNPPYKKINNSSLHRKLLREIGIETVNLYTGFVAIAIALLEKGGELVAIIPRSFCNGPYYRPFRNWMEQHAALTHMHLFDSRTEVFSDDNVLQENIIARWVRGSVQGEVTISWCKDTTFNDLRRQVRSYDEIVRTDDTERFIHIPTTSVNINRCRIETERKLTVADTKLTELGLTVSTGPVVDFRLRPHLCDEVGPKAAALLYPQHFSAGMLRWPSQGRKPNAIVVNETTERWLFPRGRYVVTKRFTSKEEARRVVAHVVEPDSLPNQPIGFENHLNVFHCQRNGIDRHLAYGLALFLNSTAVDQHFRLFSGHTQVNATDLRFLRYPTASTLVLFGKWAFEQDGMTQKDIDIFINSKIEM